jgi:hypothetical protein
MPVEDIDPMTDPAVIFLDGLAVALIMRGLAGGSPPRLDITSADADKRFFPSPAKAALPHGGRPFPPFPFPRPVPLPILEKFKDWFELSLA